MEPTGGFGDLLAAFNIDSDDTDIAYVTSQYDEANPNDAKDQTEKDEDTRRGGGGDDKDLQDEDYVPRTDIKDDGVVDQIDGVVVDQVENLVEDIKYSTELESPVNNDLPPNIGNILSTVSETATASVANCVPLPNLVPQVATLPFNNQTTDQTVLQALNNQMSNQLVQQAFNNQIPGQVSPQLPTGTVLLSNIPQPNIITPIQPLFQPPLQSFMQPLQAPVLPSNQIPFGGQSIGLLGPNNLMGLTGMNGGSTVLPQEMLQLLPQTQTNQTPSFVNVGANQNGLIAAVPMTSFLPQVMNQTTCISPVPSVTPPTPTPSPSMDMKLQGLKRRLKGSKAKNRANIQPTVLELLNEQRKQKGAKTPAAVAPQVCSELNVRQTKPAFVCSTPAVTLPLPSNSNKPEVRLATVASKSNRPEVRLGTSETKKSGRRRQQTQRYREFMSSKDESEEDHEAPKVKDHQLVTKLTSRNHKRHVIDLNKSITDQLSPVIDVNKPITDQLICMAEAEFDEETQPDTRTQLTNMTPLSGGSSSEIDMSQGPSIHPEIGSTSDELSNSTFQIGIPIQASEIKTEELSEDGAIVSDTCIKQERIDTDYDQGTIDNQNTVTANASANVSHMQDEGVVLPDGMRIKKEPTGKEDLSSKQDQDLVLSDGMRIKKEPSDMEGGSLQQNEELALPDGIKIKKEPLQMDDLSVRTESDCSSSGSNTPVFQVKLEPFSVGGLDYSASSADEVTMERSGSKLIPSSNKETAKVSKQKRKSSVWIPSANTKATSLAKKVKIELGRDSRSTSEEREPEKIIKKNTIHTREEEERVATEAAARAASSALLRVTKQAKLAKKQQTATELLEASLKQLKHEEQKRKVRNAAIEIKAAATRAASEAAARAASEAMARMIAEKTESVLLKSEVISEKKIKEAEEASKVASEAAVRAVAEAAARAALAIEAPHDLCLLEKSNQESENAQYIASLAAARAAAQAAVRANVKSIEDLVLEEKAAIEADKARTIASEAAARAAANRALTESNKDSLQAETILEKPAHQIQREEAEEGFRTLVREATARALLAAHTRTSSDFVPILPAFPKGYTKPTHIKQILRASDVQDNVTTQSVSNVVMVEPMIIDSIEVNTVLAPNKQIITYPKNPSKNLRESLAWKSFHDGVKQGKYRIVPKTDEVKSGGELQRIDGENTLVNGQDMRCPYCLIQIKLKLNLFQHVKMCLLNPQTNDKDFLHLHRANDGNAAMPPLVCAHCSPTASSVKDTKKWSNVLCRLCVTNCAHPEIVITMEDHYVITKSGFYVCKHCGIGLDNETDMKHHRNKQLQDTAVDGKVNSKPSDMDTAHAQLLEENKGLPVSRLFQKDGNNLTYQFRCGHCRLMFASVGFLLVHTSHCNLSQYFKLVERLSHYICINCPAACNVVSDDGKPHKCRANQQTTNLSKTLQANRDISLTKESFVCLRCEEILPSNGHLILHTKQCNHAQYHLLMRYIDQPPYCNKCLMVFTGYRAYAQHSHRCLIKVANQHSPGVQDASYWPSVCSKCKKSVQREDVDQMYHDATCVGLPCTQQKLLFPDGFNIKECCTLINSW